MRLVLCSVAPPTASRSAGGPYVVTCIGGESHTSGRARIGSVVAHLVPAPDECVRDSRRRRHRFLGAPRSHDDGGQVVPEVAKDAGDVRAGLVLGERGLGDLVHVVPPATGTGCHVVRDHGSGHAWFASLRTALASTSV